MLFLLVKLRQVLGEPLVEHRQDDQSKQRGRKQAEDHYHRQGPLHFRARPAGKQQAGSRPRMATRAVISTGRRRRSQPWRTASSMERPLSWRSWLNLGDQHDAVQHRHPEEGDKAHRGGDAQIEAGE